MPRRRRSFRFGFVFALLGMAAAIACYVLGVAWWQSRQHALYEFEDLLVPRLIDVVIVMWLLWIGSSIGSFLNVVAWRMPRGESLNGRSRCPRCQTRLKARDNFPVFGWLALSGRCRTCRLPISPRYPIVEAAVGISIAVVGVTELYRLALPDQANHWHGGPLWTPIIDRQLLLVLLYHVVVLSCSWACGLIRLDGNRLPGRLIAFVFACAIVPMLAYPPLMVVPWQATTPTLWPIPAQLISSTEYLGSVMRIITALAAAAFLSRLLGRVLCPAADPKTDPLGSDTAKLMDLLTVIGLPSIVVGWQAIPAVCLVAVLLTVLLEPPVARITKVKWLDALGQFAIFIPIVLTFQLAFWRRLHDWRFWPSVDSDPWVILVYAAGLLIASLWLGTRRWTDDKDLLLPHSEEQTVDQSE